jgi:hypothetical protein
MAGDGQPRMWIRGEDLIQHRLAPHILIQWRLTQQRLPQQVLLREPRLDRIPREAVVDVRAVAPAVARVAADALAEQLLHERDERAVPRQRQLREGDVGRLQTAREGRRVVRLRERDLLQRDARGPEVGGDLRLRDPGGVEVRVGPDDGAVAVLLGPVAVPGGRAVVRLGSVVVALAVAAHEQHFVVHVAPAVAVQRVDVVLEALPLRG